MLKYQNEMLKKKKKETGKSSNKILMGFRKTELNVSLDFLLNWLKKMDVLHNFYVLITSLLRKSGHQP